MVQFQVTGLKATSSLYTKKKGIKTDPANYRPITLLSCVGKLFTSISYHRLSTFLEGNSILNETQSGFRKDYSTIDKIFSLYSLTEYFKSKKKSAILLLRRFHESLRQSMEGRVVAKNT